MTDPLRITVIEIDGTVTRPLRFAGAPGAALHEALHEAMLKRGCLRDRAHRGQCMDCALLPRCAVWPLVAPADPTRRQRGPFLRPFIVRLPDIPMTGLPAGARVTYGMAIVQDATFPILWGAFADAFVRAARQIAEWGFGLAVREGEKAARRGAISVGRARWLNPITDETQLYAPPVEEVVVPPLAAVFGDESDGEESNALSMTFLTPTRLVSAGTALRQPEPAILLRRIAERLDAVADAVGAARPDLLADPVFVAAAERIIATEDATHWVGDPARGGFVGPVTLTGTPDDLAHVRVPLRWGAALGVGKGTVQGLGRFVVGPVPPTAVVVLPAGSLLADPQPATLTIQRPPAQRPRSRPPATRPAPRPHSGNKKRR